MVYHSWEDSRNTSMLDIKACVVNKDDIITEIMLLLPSRHFNKGYVVLITSELFALPCNCRTFRMRLN